jgi:hypothetical protein
MKSPLVLWKIMTVVTRGAIYLLFLNVDATVNKHQKIISTDGNFNGELDNRDIFGSSISYFGDINNVTVLRKLL